MQDIVALSFRGRLYSAEEVSRVTSALSFDIACRLCNDKRNLAVV